MNRDEMLNTVESVLRTAGFSLSERCESRPSCFCVVARKKSDVAFIRVPSDLVRITLRDALELRTVSSCFSATPLFVGDTTREKQLEDDTIYTRYDIYAITPRTLEDVVARDMFPLVEAGPGGYYVRLDGEAIRKRRIKLGLSVGKLAEQLRISRRTLYGYERGMAKASVSAAYQLEWILGIPVVKPIDIFKPVLPSVGFFATARRLISRNRFLQTVLKRLILCNFKVAATTRAPFDFIAQPPGTDVNIIGGVARRVEPNVDLRTEEILSISEIVNARPLFVTDGRFVPQSDIPLIYPQELEKIQLAEDLFSIL